MLLHRMQAILPRNEGRIAEEHSIAARLIDMEDDFKHLLARNDASKC